MSINIKKENQIEPVKKLSALDDGNLKLAPELTDHHIQVKGPQRQRMKYALQLVSGTASKAINFLGNHGKREKTDVSENATLNKSLRVSERYLLFQNSNYF